MTGVRHQESARRAKRKLLETCNRHGGKQYLHPIIDWSEADVWEYIHTYNVPYCKLYDEGARRIGCILCPYASKAHKIDDMKRWPKYAKLYEMAFDRMLERNRRDNPDYGRTWKTGKDVMKWWLGEQPKPDDGGNISLYGLRLDETDT